MWVLQVAWLVNDRHPFIQLGGLMLGATNFRPAKQRMGGGEEIGGGRAPYYNAYSR